MYEREGVQLGRSTLYGWLDALREQLAALVKAMLRDARTARYQCTAATGVLVQATEQCKRGHFWVLVVAERHVIFVFSDSHNAAAVAMLLGGYEGRLVARDFCRQMPSSFADVLRTAAAIRAPLRAKR